MSSPKIFTKQFVYRTLYRGAFCLRKVFFSDLFVFFAILTSIPQPGDLHYEPGLDVCILAEICNHTYNPECGKERKDLDIRTFMDECDMIEYNCDYKKEYILIPYEECDTNLSTKESYTVPTDYRSDNQTKDNNSKPSIIFTIIYGSTTYNGKNKDTTVTIPKTKNSPTTVTTSIHKHNNAVVCTCGATKKQVLTTANQNTSTTKLVTTTEQLSTTKSTTTTDMTTHIRTQSTQLNCTRKSTIPSIPTRNKTHTTISTTLSSTERITENLSHLPKNLADTTTASSSSILTNWTSGTTERSVTETKTKPMQKKNFTENIAPKLNVTSKSTATTIKKTPETTKPNKGTSKNANMITSPCSSDTYPKDCNRPIKWETTVKGERRDFYQILKAKYGDRLKILKGTTHWPQRRSYFRGNYNFFASHHNEG